MKPGSRFLLIKPQYEHFGAPHKFFRDKNAVLPVSELYAAALIERGGVHVDFFDRQLHDLEHATLAGYDGYGIGVRGPQSIAVSWETWDALVNQFHIDPKKIYIGGQGIEPFTKEEFQMMFPGSITVLRDTSLDDYWNLTFAHLLDKFSDEDLKVYLANELTLPFSQGCIYGCKFCAAQINRGEIFYNTRDNLEGFLSRASRIGIKKVSYYATSLDFFQQAKKAAGHDIAHVVDRLDAMSEVQAKYPHIKVTARVLARIDSLNDAMEHDHLMDAFQTAGFMKCGFGVDGIAATKIWEETGKGYLKRLGDPQDQLLKAYASLTKRGIMPENLYVFGHAGLDTKETLDAFVELSVSLMEAFPNSVYRGFVAKQIPGSAYWQDFKVEQKENYQKLLESPATFMNIGYETLANNLTHPHQETRKIINLAGIKASWEAHKRKQLQGSHTLPIADSDGHDVIDEEGYELFLDTVRMHLPSELQTVSMKDYVESAHQINRYLPRDT